MHLLRIEQQQSSIVFPKFDSSRVELSHRNLDVDLGWSVIRAGKRVARPESAKGVGSWPTIPLVH